MVLFVSQGWAAAQENALADVISQAKPGETILLEPGIYKGNVVIDKPIKMKARFPARTVIEGEGKGHAVLIKSPGVTLEGLTIRGSGKNFLENDAAIMIQADQATIRNNILQDVLFGIYLNKSGEHRIVGNQVDGLQEPTFLKRGNGLHLFYSHDNEIHNNIFHDVRDGVYVEFSNRNHLTRNEVIRSRYGVHYMWADENKFEQNYFSENVSGAAIMYSKYLELINNRFENNRGYRAFGVFFQTSEESVVIGNQFIGNTIGINSDASRGNRIEKNSFIANHIGLEMLGSNWDNIVIENNFIDNLQQVNVNEFRDKNQWFSEGKGNYWSDYEGLDIEKDGIGNQAYVTGNLFEFLMAEYPQLRLFHHSPAAKVLETVDRMFPIVNRPVIVDRQPLTTPVGASLNFSEKPMESTKVNLPILSGSIGIIFFGIILFLRIGKKRRGLYARQV